MSVDSGCKASIVRDTQAIPFAEGSLCCVVVSYERGSLETHNAISVNVNIKLQNVNK